jgi:LysM repeat protein
MTQVECPVCGKTNLAADLARCPQCSADLECFRLLDALYEQPTAGVDAQELGHLSHNLARKLDGIETAVRRLQDGLQRSQRAAKRSGAILILAGVIAAGALFLYPHWVMQQWREDAASPSVVWAELANRRAQEKAVRQELAQAAAGIAQVSRQLATLEQRVAVIATRPPVANARSSLALASDPEPEFLYHEPQPNESLWNIASTYYQQGTLYPVLLETNPGLGIYFDPDYGKLRILKDLQAAKDLFTRWVFTSGAKTFYRYPVQAEDTWKKLSERFYGHMDQAASLQALNADVPLRPGTRVTVPLPE